MGPDGELEPLDLDTLPDIDAEAVAVCLLHAYRDPSHERAVADELRRRLPGAHVVASHEVAPEFREYERASTTAADAYLGPVVLAVPRTRWPTLRRRRDCLSRSSCARRAGLRRPAEAAAHPGDDPRLRARGRVSSAPRGVAALAGIEDAIAFDMGGTSTDVCLIAGGRAERASERTVAGLADPAADRRPAHRRRRRRLARLARRGRRAARRAAERRRGSGPGVLRTRRDAADGDRREPPARAAAGAARRRRRARPRRGRNARSPGSTLPRSSTSSTPRCCARSESSRSSAGTIRADFRPRGLRRRGAAARVRAGGRARDRARCSFPEAAGVLSALGLVVSKNGETRLGAPSGPVTLPLIEAGAAVGDRIAKLLWFTSKNTLPTASTLIRAWAVVTSGRGHTLGAIIRCACQ